VIEKPEKIYLNNSNQIFALTKEDADIGNIRETFFVSMLSSEYTINYSLSGDFKVSKYTFEVGGPNKNFNQIKNIEDSYIILDNIESGINKKIPLWLFGFLY
jgi:hypothetical protein